MFHHEWPPLGGFGHRHGALYSQKTQRLGPKGATDGCEASQSLIGFLSSLPTFTSLKIKHLSYFERFRSTSSTSRSAMATQSMTVTLPRG